MSEALTDTVDRITTFIKETFPQADTAPGTVISELVVKLCSAVQNEQYNQIDELSQAKAVSQVMAATEDTYSEVIDQIASNYNTSRYDGKKSTGKVKITVAEANGYIISSGFTFIQPSLNLTYATAIETRVSPTPDSDLSEVQLYSQPDGTFFFLLDVEAAEVGSEYQLSSRTSLALDDNYSINDFVKAEAYGNFSSGLPVDTDKQVIENIRKNLGSFRLESPAGIYNRLKEVIPSFQTLSVCGANDAEMVRSKRNVLGISTFGKADVYVRTSIGPELLTVRKTGVKGEDNTWTIDIDRDDAPGFYRVTSILPVIEGTMLGGTLVANVVYAYEISGDSRNNEIDNAYDARFTRYQNAVATFEYEESPTVEEDETAEFEVTFAYQPNIADIQDLLLSDSERLACADYLAKAVVPCFVSLELGLVRKNSTDTYESLGLDKLKQDIFNYINTIEFGDDLHASKIVDICHNYGIKRVDLPILMRGDIYCVDGSSITLSDGDILSIPTDISKGVSKNTTLYFIDYYRETANGLNVIDNIGIELI